MSALKPQKRSATASKLTTTHTKSIYAADTSEARPLSPANRRHVVVNERTIAVGAREATPYGVLTCRADGDALIVSLHRRGVLVGRELVYWPEDRALLRRGALVAESAFSIEVDEFLGTPWHEVDSTVFWTVHGLRTRGGLEASV